MKTLDDFELDEREPIRIPVSLGFTQSQADRIISIRTLAKQKFKKGGQKVNAKFRQAWLDALEELELLLK